jgi:hypothetical protein
MLDPDPYPALSIFTFNLRGSGSFFPAFPEFDTDPKPNRVKVKDLPTVFVGTFSFNLHPY